MNFVNKGDVVIVVKVDNFDKLSGVKIGDIGTATESSYVPWINFKSGVRSLIGSSQVELYNPKPPKPQPTFSKELRRHFNELQYTAEWDEKLYKRVLRLHLKHGGTK